MKSTRQLFASFALVAVATLIACSTPPGTATHSAAQADPQQQAITFTRNSYLALDQAILAADAALQAGVLKGAAADRTIASMTVAKNALDATLATLKASAAAPATTAASGAAK